MNKKLQCVNKNKIKKKSQLSDFIILYPILSIIGFFTSNMICFYGFLFLASIACILRAFLNDLKNEHNHLSHICVLKELFKLEKELYETKDFLNAVEESINSMCDLGFSVKDFKKSWIKTRYNKNDKTKK